MITIRSFDHLKKIFKSWFTNGHNQESLSSNDHMPESWSSNDGDQDRGCEHLMITFRSLDHSMNTFSSLDHPMTVTRSLDHPITVTRSLDHFSKYSWESHMDEFLSLGSMASIRCLTGSVNKPKTGQKSRTVGQGQYYITAVQQYFTPTYLTMT